MRRAEARARPAEAVRALETVEIDEEEFERLEDALLDLLDEPAWDHGGAVTGAAATTGDEDV